MTNLTIWKVIDDLPLEHSESNCRRHRSNPFGEPTDETDTPLCAEQVTQDDGRPSTDKE